MKRYKTVYSKGTRWKAGNKGARKMIHMKEENENI